MWFHVELMLYLQSNAFTRLASSGVTTHLGSGMGFAAAGTMSGLTADAAAMKVGARVPKGAWWVPSPVETKGLAVGGKHGMFALPVGDEGCQRFASCGSFLLAVTWKVSCETTSKAVRAMPLPRRVNHVLRRKATFCGRWGWRYLNHRTCGNYRERSKVETPQIMGWIEGNSLSLLNVILHGNIPAVRATQIHH
jgi:hypothetical protein